MKLEPVDCLRCGKPIEAEVWDGGGMDVRHDNAGAGYRDGELLAIGNGDKGIGIIKVVQLTRAVCMRPGMPKAYAAAHPVATPEEG